MTDFRITLPCAECQGTGYLAIQTAVDVFQEHPCPVCSENGFRSHEEEYPSLAEAKADYPTALKIELWVRPAETMPLQAAQDDLFFPSMRFDGPAFEPKHDQRRLTGQILRVFDLMRDSRWRTLSEIERVTGDPAASVSAQLRHLRKERFGSHVVDKRARGNRASGLWEYRVIVREET